MMAKKEKIRNILLVNAVLTNNGDVAITLALYFRLIKAGFNVTIASHHYKKIRKEYWGLPLIADVGSSFLYRKLPQLKRVFKPFHYDLKKEFNDADAIIAVPGGFMNSYYDFNNLMEFFKFCVGRGKRLGVYANSFGPFSSLDKELFSKNANVFHVLMARDSRSIAELAGMGVDSGIYFESNDAVFLLDQKTNTSKGKKVAISVREWKKDDRNMKQFIVMMTAFVFELLDQGYSIEFLSTCQGKEGYIDDSILATRIAENLGTEVKNQIVVDRNYYNLESLRSKLVEYDVVIGTRLHMFLLSLNSGTPAFNISYEFKGKEAYDYLGFENYSVDFNDDIKTSLSKIKEFLLHKEKIKELLPQLMLSQKIESEKGFKKFVDLLIG